MKIFSGLRDRHRTEPRIPAPAAPVPVQAAISPTAALVAAQDWDELARMGREGLDALVAELRRLAALDPLPRRVANPADGDPHGTFGLIRALVDSGDPAVPGLLIELLKGFDDNADPLRGTLFEGLALTGTERAAEVLVDRALHDSEMCTLRGNSAALALAAHPFPGVVPVLVANLTDPDASVRRQVVSLLGKIPDPTSTTALVPLLADPDREIRSSAASALGDQGDQSAVLPLLIAEERDRRTRRRGQSALAYDGAPSPNLVAVDDLLGGLDAATERWQSRNDPAAVEAGVLERTAEVRERYAAAVRDALATIVESIPATPTVAELTTILTGPDVEVSSPGVLRLRDRAAFDLARGRCAGLGCTLGEETAGESWTDPQGGEDWWVSVPVTCADGELTLMVLDSYTPMY